MVFGVDDAIVGATIGALGSIGGGYLAGQGSKNKETKLQKQKRKLVDDLLASLKGDGPYSDLYKTDEGAFNKSFVEPAKAMFRNQIAPQIQQQYIASGQQRGTGLDDQLLRAGVDLDQLLNQSYLEFQNQGKNRMQSALSGALGVGDGAQRNPSSSENLMQATGGYLTSDSFSNAVKNIFQPKSMDAQPQSFSTQPTRKGFAPDWSDWKLGDPRWKQNYQG